MRAVLPEPGAGGAPRLGELPDPVAGPGELLVRVLATAINHVDLLQLRGLYPAPPGEPTIPGLEASGRILSVGEGVTGFDPGDRVTALLAGGGHAELAAVPAGQAFRVPDGWSDEEAAALPEVAVTAWTNLVAEGNLAPGETLLVSGATSAVGRFAAELGVALGARVLAVGRDAERLAELPALGALERLTFDDLPLAERPADLIVDLVGGAHVEALLGSLANRGRFVLVGLMAGRTAEIDLGRVLRNRLRIVGSVLRSRSRAEKAELVAGLVGFAAERWSRRELLPVIDRVVRFGRIADAYEHLARGRPRGKVVVRVS